MRALELGTRGGRVAVDERILPARERVAALHQVPADAEGGDRRQAEDNEHRHDQGGQGHPEEATAAAPARGCGGWCRVGDDGFVGGLHARSSRFVAAVRLGPTDAIHGNRPQRLRGERAADRALLPSASMKVAYQGEPGAYSERAVGSLFPDAEPLTCATVRLVFSRVTSGEAGFGVVPLENSQAGSVNETYELLLHTNLLRMVG